MAKIKTQLTETSVTDFINKMEEEQKRKDCFEVLKIMEDVTGLSPKMWGTSIVGFGSYHYKYESGHEGDMCLIGMSPRRQNITLYVGVGDEKIQKQLPDLGKYKTGKGCLYINKLSDVNAKVLKQIIKTSFDTAKSRHK